MKIAALTHIGSPLEILDVPIPTPQKGEVLIKVLYCGVNHLDLLIQQGKRPGPENFPHVLGSEIVGEIVSDVSTSHYKKGDTVAVYPWTFCNECDLCKNRFENICDKGGTIGRTTWGGYAEYACVPERNLIVLPQDIPQEQACATILAGVTAYHLIERAQIQNASTILVTGASGGVGTMAMQVLKNMHCTIIAATSHPQKTKQLQSLGADYVVNTNALNTEVRNIFPAGVQHVIDIVGGDMWSKSIETLGKNGTISFCATSDMNEGKLHIGSAFSRQLNIYGSYGGTKKNYDALFSDIQTKKVSPCIYKIYNLQEAQKALDDLNQMNVFGKILLKME